VQEANLGRGILSTTHSMEGVPPHLAAHPAMILMLRIEGVLP
jgi:hypothetical protein